MLRTVGGVGGQRRPWAALASGIALDAGLSLFGDTPDTRDPSADVAIYFVTHRTTILAGVAVTGAALMVFLWSMASMSERLAGEHKVAGRFALSAATVFATLVIATMLVPYAALSYSVAATSPALASSLFQITLVTAPLIAAPLAALMIAVGFAGRARTTKTWLSIASIVGGTSLLASASAFAARGLMSPDVQQQIVFGITTLWLAAVPFGTTRAAITMKCQHLVGPDQ